MRYDPVTISLDDKNYRYSNAYWEKERMVIFDPSGAGSIEVDIKVSLEGMDSREFSDLPRLLVQKIEASVMQTPAIGKLDISDGRITGKVTFDMSRKPTKK